MLFGNGCGANRNRSRFPMTIRSNPIASAETVGPRQQTCRSAHSENAAVQHASSNACVRGAATRTADLRELVGREGV